MNSSPDTAFETRLNTWVRDTDDCNDFPSRLATRSNFPQEGKINELDSCYQRSTGQRTSVVVGAISEADTMSTLSTTATEALPALTRGSSTASSVSSADTGAASGLDGGYVLESNDGILTVPVRFQPEADLLCPFQILDCAEVFSEVREFKTHVFSHFRGYNAPGMASCFLCDETFNQTPEDRPARAWNDMLFHLANAHFRQGQRLATVRTDFRLMRWMHARRIISDAQFKRTQLCPLPTILPTPVNSRLRGVINIPTAPMPPSALTRPAVETYRSARPISVGMQNEAFTTNASRRAERRSREGPRTRPGRP